MSFLDIALLSSAATTVESTPPDKAKSTFLLPTCILIFLTISLIIFLVVQDFLQLHIRNKKFSIIFFNTLYEY